MSVNLQAQAIALAVFVAVGFGEHIYFVLANNRIGHLIGGIYGPFGVLDGWARLLGY